jgi:hypothetical protein
MKRIVFAALSTSFVLAIALLTTSAVYPRNGGAQEPASLAVDTDPAGNTPTSVGTVQRCLSVSVGESFQIDIAAMDVVDLLAWEVHLIYDPSVLTLESRDVQMFLAANTGSNVFDASDAPPGREGRYRVAAADIADPPAPDSGAGVLARLSFKALAPGVSSAAIPRLDTDGNGTVDFGPILTDAAGHRIGDDDGDSYFDGLAADAWVAVGSPCPDQPPTVFPTPPRALSTPSPTAAPPTVPPLTPTPAATPPATDSDRSDGPPWAVIGVGAAAVILLAGALALWRRLRARGG